MLLLATLLSAGLFAGAATADDGPVTLIGSTYTSYCDEETLINRQFSVHNSLGDCIYAAKKFIFNTNTTFEGNFSDTQWRCGRMNKELPGAYYRYYCDEARYPGLSNIEALSAAYRRSMAGQNVTEVIPLHVDDFFSTPDCPRNGLSMRTIQVLDRCVNLNPPLYVGVTKYLSIMYIRLPGLNKEEMQRTRGYSLPDCTGESEFAPSKLDVRKPKQNVCVNVEGTDPSVPSGTKSFISSFMDLYELVRDANAPLYAPVRPSPTPAARAPESGAASANVESALVTLVAFGALAFSMY